MKYFTNSGFGQMSTSSRD